MDLHSGWEYAPVQLVHFLDPDELLGIGEGQRPQDDGVQDGEDGAGRADPERQGQHRSCGEAGALPEQFQSGAEVLRSSPSHDSMPALLLDRPRCDFR